MNRKLQLLVFAVLALIFSQHVWASPIIGRRQDTSQSDGQPTSDGNGGTPEGAPQQPDLGPFQYCDENQKGTVEFSKIEVAPLPIVPGENMTFILEGKITAAIQNNAKLVVTVRIGDQEARTNVHDICEESNQPCPIEPGNFSDNSTTEVSPQLADSAGQNVSLTLNATNGDGSLLYCLMGNLSIGEPENGGQGTNGGGGASPTDGGQSGSGTGGGTDGSGSGTGGGTTGSGSGTGDGGSGSGSGSGTGGGTDGSGSGTGGSTTGSGSGTGDGGSGSGSGSGT